MELLIFSDLTGWLGIMFLKREEEVLPKISIDCLNLKRPSPSASIPQDPIAVQACQPVKQDMLFEIPNA